jgi:hypothetical protein
MRFFQHLEGISNSHITRIIYEYQPQQKIKVAGYGYDKETMYLTVL